MNNEIEYIKKLKGYISLQDQREQPRLRAFITEYERIKSEKFNKIINDHFKMFKYMDMTFVGSGLPFYLFNILEHLNDTNFTVFSDLISFDEDNLIEIIVDDKKLNIKTFDRNPLINLIDYSPLVKKHFPLLKKLYKNIDFNLYENNINFENVKDITKNTVVCIPYSEYLYTLNELEIFNKEQTVLVFNQIEDDEKRKTNAVYCIEDLLEQCPFRQVYYADKISIPNKTSSNINQENVNLYVILGKT